MATFRFRLLALAFAALVLAPAARAGQQGEIKLPPALEKSVPETVDDLKAIAAHVENIVNKVMPAVVNVKAGGQGSGVVVSEDGYVLTAGHVFNQPGREVTITFPDGKQVKGKALGQNKSADSGLLKIVDEGKYPFCEMGKSADVQKGHWCIAIGHPGGLKPGRMPPVRLGRVGSPGGAFITTECTLVGGDSGGPLFDMQGKVIGIHSRIGGSITANMHVPVDVYRADWDRLVKGEAWGTGGGKGGQNTPKSVPGRVGGVEFAADAKDLTVAKVTPGSTADKVGLKADDIIVAVNGKKIGSASEWRAEMQRGKAGDTVMIEIRRGGESTTLKVVLDKSAA